LRKSTISFNFFTYFIEVTFLKLLAKQAITKLEKSIYLEDFEIESCIATSTQSIKLIKTITSSSQYYRLIITINSSSNKIVNKRSKQNLAVKMSFIKKTC